MRKSRAITAILLVLALTITIVGCGTQQQDGQIKDGTYQGEGVGKGGKILVEVKIKNGKIDNVKVLEHNETEGLCEEPIKEIIEKIVKENSFDVDIVTGATLTSKGIIEAVKDALDKAKGLKDVAAKSEDEKEEPEQTYDVVVVGGGGAGLAAAIEAHDNGASVVVLEKMSSVGGNTMISGGEMAAAGNWIQKEEGIEDSIEKHVDDTLKGGDHKNDKKLVTKLATEAAATAKWLRDHVGVIFEDHLFMFGGHTVKRSLIPKGASGFELIEKLEAKVKELDIPIKLETKALELIKDGDKITGVKAEKNGEEIVFHANNGVVLATGGFGSNVEMRKRFNPEYDEHYLSTNSEGITGDGITMAEAVGADLVGMEYIQSYPICDPLTGKLLYVDDARFISTILVNKEGKRFVEELDRRDVISSGIINQTDSCAYEVWDQHITDISKIAEHHKAEIDYLFENDLLVKADTIKEAAEFFDIDAQQLEKTVARYNKFAKSGKDEDFNKRGEMIPLEKPPYYILKAVPAIHHTMGGIKIDTNAHVIDKNGSIIKGLYAAGEVTGGIHGINRLGSNAIADIMVFGRTAGKNAAEKK